MNLSGEALRPLSTLPRFDPTTDLLVLVDDVALPLGTFRIRAQGSDGGHNGLASVEAALGTDAYGRLRIGVGPVPEDVDDQADFVLGEFTRNEMATYADLLPTLVDAIDCWLADGIDAAMNRFNRRPSED